MLLLWCQKDGEKTGDKKEISFFQIINRRGTGKTCPSSVYIEKEVDV
jgi:hypothetical protein